jgi:hypothetical protein
MVTQTSDVSSGSVLHDRGFVTPESTITAEYRSNRFMFYPAPFWGPVIAGSLFVLSTFVLSWYLMLGCSVGVSDHVIDLGWGAAIWMWVTSGVAFFAGGMIANMISAPRGFGWLKGAAIWALSIPLGLVAYSFVTGTGVFALLGLPHPGMVNLAGGFGLTVHYSFMWAVFITLAVGLIFSAVGSMIGQPYLAGTESLAGTATGPAVVS